MKNTGEILDPIDRPSLGVSWVGVILGILIGVGAGLFYTWQVDPIIIRNVSPADLQPQDQQIYVVSIAQEYAATGDLQRAVARLIEVDEEGDPFLLAAQTACDLIRSGQIDTVTGLQVIRNLRSIYEPQGVVAPCDTSAFNTPVPVTVLPSTPTITPTTTITPVATKTPTQAFVSSGNLTPQPSFTPIGAEDFRIALVEAFCDSRSSGMIEVYVLDETGGGLPGVAVEVSWDNARQRQTFYTGLKPERGDEYADFKMETGELYRVGLLESRGSTTNPLETTLCDGEGTMTSYRVVIQKFEEEED